MSDSLPKPYPWQNAAWHSLMGRVAADRLPHALLFTGPAGIGKGRLARVFAQALLCDSPETDGTGCGRCRGCTLFAAGSHPDFVQTVPVEEGKGIAVDQVRALAGFQGLTGQYGARRVVLLEPADRLNLNAANALLKTLEEPTAGTVMLMITSRPAALLPTIRSRCQQVALPPASLEEAGEWLQGRLAGTAAAADLLAMAGGAPLAALELADGGQLAERAQLFDMFERVANGAGPVGAMADAAGLPPERILVWFYGWVADMARLKTAADPHLSNPDLRNRLQALADKVDLMPLLLLLERVQRAAGLLRGNINAQLLVEELVIIWGRCQAARQQEIGAKRS